MLNYIRNKKGFTLVEIIVVLVIIAILAATTLPALTGYIDDARSKTAISEGRTVLVAAQTIASQMMGDSVAQNTIEDHIEGTVTTGSKYPTIDKLIGSTLKNKPTGVVVNPTGTVTAFSLVASGKNVVYGSSSGFTAN